MTLIDKLTALEGEEARIVGKLDRTGDCWLWTGALDYRNRGRIWYKGKLCLHHRAIWRILIGPIPNGALLCHHCDNPTCANPDHLYIGTPKSNVQDMMDRGRNWQKAQPDRMVAIGKALGSSNNWCRGSKNAKAKLTEAEVVEIFKSKEKTRILSERYSVGMTTIQRIRRGKQWTHVTAALRARSAMKGDG